MLGCGCCAFCAAEHTQTAETKKYTGHAVDCRWQPCTVYTHAFLTLMLPDEEIRMQGAAHDSAISDKAIEN